LAHFSFLSQTHPNKTERHILYEYMSDFNNFKHLLPTEKIENFTCSNDQCSFGIKGMAPLTIKLKNKINPSQITFETSGLAKFIFTLHIHFLENQSSNVQLEGDMNPFIKVMTEKPLNDLINVMALKLSELELS
jgi:hypothetical protein